MKPSFSVITAALAIATFATPGPAQTSGELLQKGIYTQETTGDLNGAIAIYRQIASSPPGDRSVGAQAQYRLAQIYLQKGDLAAAAREFNVLSTNYSEFGGMIARLTPSFRAQPAPERVDNAMITALATQIAGTMSELALARTQLLETHPKVRGLEAQLRNLEGRLDQIKLDSQGTPGVLRMEPATGALRGGRFHHTKTGIEFDVPNTWRLITDGPAPSGGEEVRFRPPAAEREISVWFSRDQDLSAELDRTLPPGIAEKLKRGEVGLAGGIHRQVGSHDALSAVSEFQSGERAMVRYETYIHGSNSRAIIKVEGLKADLASIRSQGDKLTASMLIP